jgi:hypothetical protein
MCGRRRLNMASTETRCMWTTASQQSDDGDEMLVVTDGGST